MQCLNVINKLTEDTWLVVTDAEKLKETVSAQFSTNAILKRTYPEPMHVKSQYSVAYIDKNYETYNDRTPWSINDNCLKNRCVVAIPAPSQYWTCRRASTYC